MKYILSQEEIDDLVPKKDWQKYHFMLCELRTIYLIETGRKCIEREQFCYCVDCPIEKCCTQEKNKAFPK